MLFKILQRKMNEKIKKVFASIGVFFTGVFTSLLCVFGISLYNNRNETKTAGRKQSDIEAKTTFRFRKVIQLFLIDNATVTDKEIEDKLSKKAKFITEETSGIFIFRDDKITEIKIPQEVSVKTHSQGNLNVTPISDFVNKNLTGQEESNPSILYQTAYHGTPHNFDRFSTSAIGTGERNQSFGWGLYFTNQEDIARWYADKLSKNNIEIYREQLKQGSLDNPYN